MVGFSQERRKELAENAKAIASCGKGILAADESTGTIKKRFDAISVENTEVNRAAYRELLFTTKDLNKHISGVILFEETLFQKTASGVPMTKLLRDQGIIIGIKTDKGLVDLPGTEGEKSTTGLDGLLTKSQEYYAAGARFAKWRAVLTIDPVKGIPTDLSISETAHTLARYAAISQEAGLVPIVEPEILTDGSHSIEVCADVTERVVAACFVALRLHRVLLEGALLKPNMVTAGASCKNKPTSDDVAFYTVRTLKRTVPPALPGVMFLSGGQSEEEASLNLNAINKLGPHPWALSFSYGRALQSSVLEAWKGKTENVAAAQETLFERAKANSEAQLAKYKGGGGSTESLYVSNYVY